MAKTKFAARDGKHSLPSPQQPQARPVKKAKDDSKLALKDLSKSLRQNKMQEEQGQDVTDDDAEDVPLAELSEFLSVANSKKKKGKKKRGTRTRRDGLRPCANCMRKAIARCSACFPQLRAIRRLPSFSGARSTEDSLEITLRNDTGREAKLCERCAKACVRSYEELGGKQWGKAMGTAEHCAICEPSRHPKLEDVKDFRMQHLTSLRKNKEKYAQTSRKGFVSQQRALARTTSKKSAKSVANLSQGRAKPASTDKQ